MKPLDEFENKPIENSSSEKITESKEKDTSENIHYRYYKEENSLELFSEKEKKTSLLNELESIPIKIASPEKIKEWSYGEVVKPSDVHCCKSDRSHVVL